MMNISSDALLLCRICCYLSTKLYGVTSQRNNLISYYYENLDSSKTCEVTISLYGRVLYIVELLLV